MKKLLVSTILATSTFLPLFVQANETNAQVNYPIELKAINKLTVHKGATTAYAKVREISAGQKVTVIDEFTNAFGEKWYRIDLGSIKGWAESSNIEKKETISSNQQLIQVTNASVRKGATTSYPIVSTLKQGSKVTVIDEFTNSTGQKWLRIDLGSVKGWTEASNLVTQQTTNQKQIQIGNAPVHKGATTSYPIVTFLKQDQMVSVIDEFTNASGDLWYRVDLGSVKGWVHSTAFVKNPLSENVSVPEEETIEPTAPPITEENPAQEKIPEPTVKAVPNGTIMYSTSLSESVRKGASHTYASVTTLTLGQKVTVVDHFIDPTSVLWYRVEYSLGKMGWVKAEILQQKAIVNKTFYISVDVANVRKGPALTEPKLITLRKGTALKVIDQSIDTNRQIWYKFISEDNTQAWVHESVVTDKVVPVQRLMAIGTRHAKLYKGATLQYSTIENLTYFSKVTVLQEFINASNQRWLRVKTPSGKIGWIPSWEAIISVQDYKYVYPFNDGSIRKGAADSYAVAGTFRAGDELIRLWQHGNWLNVETKDGKRGWVKQSDTSPTSIKKLLSPSFELINGESHLIWKKPNGFSFPYKMLSNNRLELAGLTQIDIPNTLIPGITRYELNKISPTNHSLIIHFQPGYTFTIRNHADSLSLKVMQVGLVGKKILIDAGHGGSDPGAIGRSGLYEKVVTLDTALLLKAELEKAGAIVQLTRSDDKFLTLQDRTLLSNLSDYDAFISLHTDSFTNRDAKGTTTFYNTSLNFNGTKSYQLGQTVQKHLIANLGTSNRGVKNQEFYVNKRNELPSILIELAFLSNPTEEALLKTTEFRYKAALAIKNALEEYFSTF